MREEYLDAISELEESLSPFHLESDGEWTNYEFNTSTIRVAIEALEKQVTKKPNVKELPDAFGRLYWSVCGACDEEIESDYDYCPDCGQRIDWEENQ